MRVISALIDLVLGLVTSLIEPYATGDGTVSLLVRGFAIRRRNASRLRHMARELHKGTLKGKTLLVTGSARGLGSGIASHLAASGARMVLPLRDGTQAAALRESLAARASAVVREFAENPGSVADLRPADVDVLSLSVGLELGSFESIERFVEALSAQGIVLDCIVNNAGMVPISQGLTTEGFERAFGINYLGTVYFTQLLVEKGLLKPDAKIINVSSEEHRLASLASHLPQGGRKAGDVLPLGKVPSDASVFNAMERYAYSKLLLTASSHELDRRVSQDVIDICPGPVASEIARDAPWPIGDITKFALRVSFPSPADAALAVVERVIYPRAAPAASTSAVHYHMSELKAAGSGAGDEATGAWLWAETAKLLRARRPPA
jgi:NAD(P)-dependent dehydrogenase (short-subunit alcohol dehydrogenase family)